MGEVKLFPDEKLLLEQKESWEFILTDKRLIRPKTVYFLSRSQRKREVFGLFDNNYYYIDLKYLSEIVL